MNTFKIVSLTVVAVLLGIFIRPADASAHWDTTTQVASCYGYNVKADYHGGSEKRRVIWDVTFVKNGASELIQGQWTGISPGFNIFSRTGSRASVTATGTVKMYEQQEVCDWKWKWNPYKHKNEWTKDCTTEWKEIDNDSFDLHFDANSCAAPTPTPTATPNPTTTPQPTVTPSPSMTPSPTATPEVTPAPTSEPTPAPTTTATPNPTAGKQSKMSLPEATCDNNNMDASIELFNDGNPAAGVNVKFIYENEAKFAKTEANGRAGVLYGYKAATDVVIEPEDGYPSQRQQAHISSTNCPAKPSTAAPQVLGLADTGIIDDTIANLAGVFGTLSTVIGSVLYAKNKKQKTRKNAKK